MLIPTIWDFLYGNNYTPESNSRESNMPKGKYRNTTAQKDMRKDSQTHISRIASWYLAIANFKQNKTQNIRPHNVILKLNKIISRIFVCKKFKNKMLKLSNLSPFIQVAKIYIIFQPFPSYSWIAYEPEIQWGFPNCCTSLWSRTFLSLFSHKHWFLSSNSFSNFSLY